ncbi:baseplate wedge subunit [Vibrio phage D479]
MKQTINVGSVVDDGTGDYLRASSIKTRDNFDEIYRNLGDGANIFAAGAWRTWRYSATFLNGDTTWDDANREAYFDEDGNGRGPYLNLRFGESWVIDTSIASVELQLPPGVEEVDYGKSIRIRDARGTWDRFKVTIKPDPRDSIKRVAGSSSVELGKSVEFTDAYQDLELVFTPPRHWEYVAQKYVNGLTFGDVPSVLRRAILAREGQRDFNIEAELGGEYNSSAVEVYRRGNLMYYGSAGLQDASDYGSIPLHTVPAWIPNNPNAYMVGDLVVGQAGTAYDDRIWQCNTEHNSTGAWEPTYWTEFADKPDYAEFAGSTAYTAGTIVYQTIDTYDELFECLVAHTSAAGTTDLTTDNRWRQITNGDLAPLDGRTIRLRLGAVEGDPIACVTYLADVSSFRSSYVMRSIQVVDEGHLAVEAVPGQIVSRVLEDGMQLTLADFAFPAYTQYNTETLEVLVNGTLLIPANTAGLGDANSGTDYDYDTIQDADGRWNGLQFNEPLVDSDIVTIRWFDNVIGTLLTWDEGQDNIQSRSRDIFVSRDDWSEIRRTNTMTYSDPANPNAGNATIDPDAEVNAPGSNLTDLMKTIYPIGSVYINANNPNNPFDYMGFGTWVRYGEGQAIVGWNSQDDGTFHRNNNNGNIVQAGGTGGNIGVTLVAANIPELISTTNPNYANPGDRDIGDVTEQYSLVARSTASGGSINLNGCLGDPTDYTPLSYYAEEPIKVNHGNVAVAVDVVQPFITAYTWIRTE